MGLAISLKLLAGVSALALSAAIFFRGPIRWRNRSFALLSLALAVWHLGHSGLLLSGRFDLWYAIMMVGSLASGPLGLDFALTLSGRFWRDRRRWVLPVALVAVAIWYVMAITPFSTDPRAQWLTLGFLAVTLTFALGSILRQAWAMGEGPGRRALLGIFLGGLLVVAGGVTDLIPRQGDDLPDVGALATLLFLAIVCSVILRHHLLDIDGLVLRSVGTLAVSATATVLLWVIFHRIGDRGFALFFLAGLVVIVPLIFLAPYLRLRARSLLQPNDPLIHELSAISGHLPHVTKRQEVFDRFREASDALPPPIRLELVLDLDPRLATLLEEEPFLTLRFLDDALVDARDERRDQLRHAAEWMREQSWGLMFRMSGEHQLVGGLAVGGPLPERYLTESVAAAGAALANQTASCLARIDAIEAAERDKSILAVGKIAARLAHDIRNPLAALRGAGQAMGDAATPEQRSSMLQVIHEESARLESFVQEFLEFAIPKTLNRSAVDLDKLSRDAIRACEAAGRSFSIAWDLEQGVPPLSGDAELLRRAFDNLVRNALEAGGETVTITVILRKIGDAAVEWSVEDDGPGIAEGGIERMTEPYFTTKASGSGLGLALVHRVVEQHGGRLAMGSRPGGGARFAMTLPIEADR